MIVTERTLMESLETLPSELRQNFHSIEQHNEQCSSLMQQIDERADSCLESLAAGNCVSSRTAALSDQVTSLYGRLRKYSDNNVQLAMKAYSLVDRYIQKLDVDLGKFEAQLKDSHLSGAGAQERGGQVTSSEATHGADTCVTGKGAHSDHSNSRHHTARAPGTTRRKKKRRADSGQTSATVGAKRARHTGKISSLWSDACDDSDEPASAQPKKPAAARGRPSKAVSVTDTLDMPVDPNEPTYCLCNQVSFGDMIGCDNAQCAIEWFHFACVGLSSTPRGKWYCPRCRDKKR